MNRHWKGMLTLIALTVVGLVIAAVTAQPMIAFMAVTGAVVAGYVLGIAWARPENPPEHPFPPAPDDRFSGTRQP